MTDGWLAGQKDELEAMLNHLVCEGRLPLRDAQAAIAHDWTAAYERYLVGKQ